MLVGKLKRKLSEMIDMPVSSFGGCSFVSIEGKYSVKINGCVSIAEYGNERITLRLCDGNLVVYGRNMTMNSYGGNAAIIKGEIDTVSFPKHICN